MMRHVTWKSHHRLRRRHSSAFTLVELLVVVGIMILLTAMTVSAVSSSINADRVRAGARQIQSLLAGARDRAIYAKDIRGLRLIRDPNDNHVVNAFQYVGAPAKFSVGTLTIIGGTTINGNGTNFGNFKNMGLVKVGSRIQIPSGTGRWYTIAGFPGIASGGNPEWIMLSKGYSDSYNNSATNSSNISRSYSGVTYLLELQPQPLAESSPVQLPKGAVIDLDGSQVPLTWLPASFLGAYGASSTQMDIMFSAKGLPVGDVASIGNLHLHVADAGDVTQWKILVWGRNLTAFGPPVIPADSALIPGGTGPLVTRDHILVSMTSRTGNVGVYPVNTSLTFINNSGTGTLVLSDPYYYAETGGVAGK